ncbi:MAG: ClbS/DfsB family four-helix bundle protein [Oscillospiraceae bacterium]|jgi:hypothetical protein|nr:ClbS/DfsB family four-helix bundle protein [Oscillospiraceae bacterium]
MPRPTTKADLIAAAETQFAKLWALIDAMPAAMQTAPFAFEDRDKTVRDVLVHLYEWHQLLLRWAPANLAGEPRPFLPPPYTWKTYGDMNVELWEKHQGTPYGQSRDMLTQSHAEAMALIEGFTDEQLFTKQYYKWTGTTNLGSYCVSATSSHYDWAMKKLKNHVKTYQG